MARERDQLEEDSPTSCEGAHLLPNHINVGGNDSGNGHGNLGSKIIKFQIGNSQLNGQLGSMG